VLANPDNPALWNVDGGSATAGWNDSATAAGAPTGAPVSTTAPAAPSGSAIEGDLLTADDGSWTNTPTSFTYQWEACNPGGCTDIAGATGNTYTTGHGDTANTIRVKVTAHNGVGASASAASAPTAIIEPDDCDDVSTGVFSNTTTGLELLSDSTSQSLCVANTDGSGPTLLAASGNWYAPSNDQIGDVYFADATGYDIMESVDGASPVTYQANACPNSFSGDDGPLSDYQVFATAASANGQDLAWFCQDNYAAEHNISDGSYQNGYIMLWNGTTTTRVWSGDGVTSTDSLGVPTSFVNRLALSPDGSKLAFVTTDETVAAFQGGTQPNAQLYIVPTDGSGDATVLDPGAGDDIADDGDDDNAGNYLAFVDGATKVAYDVAADAFGTTSTIYEVPVAGGSPIAVLAPDGSGNSWRVVGPSDATADGFACQETANDGSGHAISAGVCDASGTVTSSITLPSTDGGPDELLGYSATTTGYVPPSPPTLISAPTITDTSFTEPTAGDSLTTNGGSWTGSPTSFTYQWLDCPRGDGTGNSLCHDVGTNTSSYTLSSNDVNQIVRVQVTAANLGGSSSPADSSSTDEVETVGADAFRIGSGCAFGGYQALTFNGVDIGTWPNIWLTATPIGDGSTVTPLYDQPVYDSCTGVAQGASYYVISGTPGSDVTATWDGGGVANIFWVGGLTDSYSESGYGQVSNSFPGPASSGQISSDGTVVVAIRYDPSDDSAGTPPTVTYNISP
jgi:hypothetical protein